MREIDDGADIVFDGLCHGIGLEDALGDRVEFRQKVGVAFCRGSHQGVIECVIAPLRARSARGAQAAGRRASMDFADEELAVSVCNNL